MIYRLRNVVSVFLSVVMCLAVNPTTGNTREPSNDLKIIFARHVALAMSDAKNAEQQVPEILKRRNPAGFFTDLDYECTTRDKGEILLPHLDRLKILAQAWYDSSSSRFQDNVLKQYIFQAMSAWVNTDPRDQNWWWRTIGWPNHAWQAPVLLRSVLKQERPDLFQAWIDYLLYSWRGTPMTGANATDVQIITLAAASLADDLPLMQAVISRAAEEFNYVTGTADGLYSDGSYHQHNARGRQLHHGSYGSVPGPAFSKNRFVTFLTGIPRTRKFFRRCCWKQIPGFARIKCFTTRIL